MNVDVSVMLKVKKKRKFSIEFQNCMTIYSGVASGRRAALRVAAMINKDIYNSIHCQEVINKRIITVRYKTGKGYIKLTVLYSPE